MKTNISFIECIACIVCIICIVCISPNIAAQVKDDFSDGNFSDDPPWTVDVTQFEINAAGQLHLRSAGSDTAVLATQSTVPVSAEWDFWIKLSFNTSSNNHARVYLAANSAEFTLPVNAYYIQIGGSDDSIAIMRQTVAQVKKIYSLKSYLTDHSTNTMRIKIIRDESAQWKVMIDTTGGYNYIEDGTFFEEPVLLSGWFGVYCRYTSSNATKFYFDDFYAGPVIRDTLSPKVISVEVATANDVSVVFSEPPDKVSAEDPGNYRFLNKSVRMDSVRRDPVHPGEVSIFLKDPIPDGTIDSIYIHGITDLSGNKMADTIVPVCYYRAKPYDILIHEIMADPDPPVELPDAEYIELFNRASFPINLRNWTIRYGSYSKVFLPVTIPSRGYLLITRDSAYLHFASCSVLFTSSSSLSNEGTTLVLTDDLQHVIHAVTYSPSWYRGSFKEEGGWSLEMIDALNPCGCTDNWAPSKDISGGTPGRANSVSKSNMDEEAPFGLRAVITDSVTMRVTFSEQMDSISMLQDTDWLVQRPGRALHPARVIPLQPHFSSADLYFDDKFEKGVTYILNVSAGLKDCTGNRCDTTRTLRFAIPDSVAMNDVVINEVLSNPSSGGSRFVELYNRSEKILDLQALIISGRDTMDGLLQNAAPLSEDGYLLFPGAYAAFTPNKQDILDRFAPASPANISGMPGFPVLGDDTGTVIIARKDNLEIVDRMKYNPDMHYPLLATSEGVSLERTSPDLPSATESNWHSAAETSGFGTPGYQNSHRVVVGESSMNISVQPEVFSPDNDGHDDLLSIVIREDDPDYAVSIVAYDTRGRLVREIANNVLTGSEGVFIWDGMTDGRSKAPIGFYVLLIELTRPDGTVRKSKKTVVLGGRF
jgi:hypothetical protein